MPASQPFHPVIIGSDIGIYALVRCFYEQWGTKATCVCFAGLGPIQHSRILDIHTLPKARELEEKNEAIVSELITIAPELKQKHGVDKLVLITNSDTYIFAMNYGRERLAEHYEFLIPPEDVLYATTDKTQFASLADKFSMTTPPTVEANLDDPIDTIMQRCEGQSYPMIVKPTVSMGYEILSWEGKHKVDTVASPDELRELLTVLEEKTRLHPTMRRFLIQRRIEGNDTYNLSITAYADSHGKVTMMGSAHVLLEDHAPTFLGNPGAMITEVYPDLHDQARRFLEGVGWRGFANFDVKVDRHTNTPYFFEVNPRIGRNCYYNVAAGVNPTELLVRDLIFHERCELRTAKEHAYYRVLPDRLVKRYIDTHLWKQIRYLRRQHKAVHPLLAPAEKQLSLRYLKRRLVVTRNLLNHWVKFHRYYPRKAFVEHGQQCLHTEALQR
ncbi:MAG: ATP-grasp domain-containing protein [Actinomycetaceae bacterium]|nr:ATP-grasp domain-containing protein [Actinomycetaceae bacterium]